MNPWEWIAHMITTPTAPWWSNIGSAVAGGLITWFLTTSEARRNNKQSNEAAYKKEVVDVGLAFLDATKQCEDLAIDLETRTTSGVTREQMEEIKRIAGVLTRTWMAVDVVAPQECCTASRDLLVKAHALLPYGEAKNIAYTKRKQEYSDKRSAFIDTLRKVKGLDPLPEYSEVTTINEESKKNSSKA